MCECQLTIGDKALILIATGALFLAVAALAAGSQAQPLPGFSPIATVFVPLLVNNHATTPVPAAPIP